MTQAFLVFSSDFIDNSIKHVFENKKLPITPLSGVDSNLFEEAKEIGLEKHIQKMKRLILMKSSEIPKFSSKTIDLALKSKKTVTVTIGPNNVHDILDSLENY